MYLEHSDRLLTRSTRGSSIYRFCTDYLSSLNIFLLFEVVLFEQMLYLYKRFYLNRCSIYTNYSISASDSIYMNYPNLTSTTPHTKNSRQLNIRILYRVSIQFEYFRTAWSCSIYMSDSRASIYTNYSSFTSATQYCNYTER